MGNIFDKFLVVPIVNVLVVFYQLLAAAQVPYALGFAIILLTVFIRLLLYPLTTAQLKASKKMQELSPHLTRVREKHKGDAARVQQETMRLYKEHGVNPAAGCLPVLIQIPVIWALYTVLQKIVMLNGKSIVSEINKMLYDIPGLQLTSPWDPHFFGIPLGQSPAQLFQAMGPIVLAIAVITGVLQLIQSKMMFAKPAASEKTQEVKKEEKKSDDFSSIMQTQSLYIFPVMIGFFSHTLPVGLSLYWNTFTIFGILQQYKIQGLGGLSDWKEKIYGKK